MEEMKRVWIWMFGSQMENIDSTHSKLQRDNTRADNVLYFIYHITTTTTNKGKIVNS